MLIRVEDKEYIVSSDGFVEIILRVRELEREWQKEQAKYE